VLLASEGRAGAALVLPAQPSSREGLTATVLKEHLDAMTGAVFPVVRFPQLGETVCSPAGMQAAGPEQQTANFVLVGRHNALPKLGVSLDGLGPEGMVLKTAGNVLVVAGADDLGLRHATYALLEALGCRYLWPGDLGKVVPHRPTLYAPQLDVREAPRLWNRAIRSGAPVTSRTRGAFTKLGIAPEAYQKLFHAAVRSSLRDDGWFAWHRLGTHRAVRRGHSFGAYWTKFGKEHPDWFALQPTGVRDQSLSSARPRLCHSNPELIRAVVEEKIEELRADPTRESVAVGLNDGGRTTFCLCERCRRLDPADGPPITLANYARGFAQRFAYVSLSDRVLWFANRIADGVTQASPDTHLGYYAYSVYNSPPLRTKPHPNLVVFYVGMSYANEEARTTAQRDWALWSRFDNKLYWRPNCLLAHRKKPGPQNFARKLFADFRSFYRTGMIGTDFDSCLHQWALKGLAYYVLAKAHWDPTAMTYEETLADYCRSGFGEAAEAVRTYFGLLEELTDEAALRKARLPEVLTPARSARLQACLDQAKAAVADPADGTARRRVEFLELGLTFGETYAELYAKKQAGAGKAELAESAEALRALLKRIVAEQPLAVNAPIVALYCRLL